VGGQLKAAAAVVVVLTASAVGNRMERPGNAAAFKRLLISVQLF
jgi:hypothetical protein